MCDEPVCEVQGCEVHLLTLVCTPAVPVSGLPQRFKHTHRHGCVSSCHGTHRPEGEAALGEARLAAGARCDDEGIALQLGEG